MRLRLKGGVYIVYRDWFNRVGTGAEAVAGVIAGAEAGESSRGGPTRLE